MNSVASTTAPVRVPARPTSAKKARSATVVRATQDSKSKAAPVEDESGFWRKVFLPNGKEEVKSEDYQKFQTELKAQKAANAKKAEEKEKGCVIM
jgi:hypothetical protein